jgi:hypothetical protein
VKERTVLILASIWWGVKLVLNIPQLTGVSGLKNSSAPNRVKDLWR